VIVRRPCLGLGSLHAQAVGLGLFDRPLNPQPPGSRSTSAPLIPSARRASCRLPAEGRLRENDCGPHGAARTALTSSAVRMDISSCCTFGGVTAAAAFRARVSLLHGICEGLVAGLCEHGLQSEGTRALRPSPPSAAAWRATWRRGTGGALQQVVPEMRDDLPVDQLAISLGCLGRDREHFSDGDPPVR
jgi:hypothetical protein